MNRLLLAAVALLIVSVSVVRSQRVRTTSGLSGPMCWRRRCLSVATCIRRRCRCPDGFRGNGAFGCFPEWFHESDVIGDPLALTFGKEKVDTPLPCRVLFTHVRTEFITDSHAHGTCDFKLYTYNTRMLGKFFTVGFDAYIVIYDDDSNTMKTVAFRVIGEGMNGTYTFTEWGKADGQNAGPWGGAQDVIYYGQRIRIIYEDVDNRATLNIQACGIMLTFRPFDFGLRSTQQVQIPGICIAFESKQKVEWLSQDKVISLPPITDNTPTVGKVARAVNLAPVEAFIHRSLVSNVDQQFPGGAEKECTALSQVVMTDCRDSRARQDAFEMCSYIILSHKFVKCWSEPGTRTSSRVLDLYRKCLEAWCTEDAEKCNSIVTEISESKCSKLAKAEMVEFDCVFNEP